MQAFLLLTEMMEIQLIVMDEALHAQLKQIGVELEDQLLLQAVVQ